MSWSNRIFNVNGRGVGMLEMALTLACSCGVTERGFKCDSKSIVGCLVSPEHGLIWLWAECDGATMYPVPLTPKMAAEISIKWLESDAARSMKCENWDANKDHDGDNSKGWRAYCGDWGHIGKAGWAAIVAVGPVFLWHG